MKKLALLLLILVACENSPKNSPKSVEAQRITDSIENANERKAYLNDSSRYNEEQKIVADLKKTQTESSANVTPSRLRIIGTGSYSAQLSVRLAYLTELEEVNWVEIDNNTVYIGVNTRTDLKMICNGAAFHGNKEIGFGCHVFAIDANKYASNAACNNTYMYETTCRNGTFE